MAQTSNGLIEKYCEVIDTTDWEEKRWFNSGGTRNKKILSDSTGDLFYFKESLRKVNKDYKYEFYSEVIASFIGEMIGLKILNYHISIFGDRIGCLSKSMITGEESLIEGKQYLKAFDMSFMKDDVRPKERYNFQLIEDAFKTLGKSKSIPKIIDVILFDCLIGNSDRHQENWGFIGSHTKET